MVGSEGLGTRTCTVAGPDSKRECARDRPHECRGLCDHVGGECEVAEQGGITQTAGKRKYWGVWELWLIESPDRRISLCVGGSHEQLGSGIIAQVVNRAGWRSLP